MHFRNASWSGISAGIRAVTGLITSLLAIRLLGADSYGQIVTLLSLFVLYLSLNSSVFTMLVVNLMGTSNEVELLNREATIYVAAKFSIFSIAILVAVSLSLCILTTRISLGLKLQPDILFQVILFMGLLTSIQIFVALQAAIIEASNRLDLATKWQLTGPLSIVFVLGICFFNDIVLNANSYIGLLCIGYAIDMLMLWRIRRKLGLNMFIKPQFNVASISMLQLLRRGGLLQGASLLNLFLEPANKFLLIHFSGSSTVTLYDLAMKVIWGIQHLVGAAMRVFLHIGSQDSAAVGNTFVKTIVLLCVPVIVMHTAGALFLFWSANYWINIDGTKLMIFYGIASMSNLGMIFVTPLYLSLIGRSDLIFIFRTQAILATINILVCSATIPLLGLVGAAFGLLVATIFNVIAIYLRCNISSDFYKDKQLFTLKRSRISLAFLLLISTVIWTTIGGRELLMVFIIITSSIVIMLHEPLTRRMYNQFSVERS